MLWTDASARDFVATNYPWFLDTFDGYTYPIQRADAIRYFVLYHYGGIYYDLDIGCLRPLDPLLIYPVILPKTIPVGVSNDLMFAEKGHPFLEQTIHHLTTFDHSWVLNYPTVMFSTGPMFLSAQYGLYTSSHPDTKHNDIRILPKSLYGKNAKEGEAPHSFFSHFYGSSWHADDAAFIGFLGKWGKVLMWIGLVILIIGITRLIRTGGKQRIYGLRNLGGYEVLLPRWTQRQGRWYLDLGWFAFPASISQGSRSDRRLDEQLQGDVNYIPLESSSSARSSSDMSPTETLLDSSTVPPHPLMDAVRQARNRFMPSNASFNERLPVPQTPLRSRGFGSRGVLFFLPAFWSRDQDIELASTLPSPPPLRLEPVSRSSRSTSRAARLPPEKQRYAQDLERAGLLDDSFTQDHPEGPEANLVLTSSHSSTRDLTETSESRNARRNP